MNMSDAGKLGWLKTKDKHHERFRAFKDRYCSDPKHCAGCDKVLPYEKRYNSYLASRV